MNEPADTAPIRQRFGALAEHYDQYSAIFDEVGTRLLERLDGLRFAPERILDLGCGTGRHSLALRTRYPDARLLAVDHAPQMLAMARRRRGRWRPRFELACADLSALPIAEASIDLVFANLSLQWSPDLAATLAGLRRIMRPRGIMMMTLPGPDTLRELRQAGAIIEMGITNHAQEMGDVLTRAGFQEPVLDTDWLTSTHANLDQLLEELHQLGLKCRLPVGRQAFESALNGQQTAVTWEMLYATAWSPDEGQPIRTDAGEEASVSAASLGIRKRRS